MTELKVASADCAQMGLHGAPLIYGLFMRPRSAVIEFRPHEFEGEHHVRSKSADMPAGPNADRTQRQPTYLQAAAAKYRLKCWERC